MHDYGIYLQAKYCVFRFLATSALSFCMHVCYALICDPLQYAAQPLEFILVKLLRDIYYYSRRVSVA